jgi:hypothetical protein
MLDVEISFLLRGGSVNAIQYKATLRLRFLFFAATWFFSFSLWHQQDLILGLRLAVKSGLGLGTSDRILVWYCQGSFMKTY